MEDRLLSEQEFDEIVLDEQYKTRGERIMALLKAQDTKTAAIVRKEVNEEWVSVLRNHSYDGITAFIPDIVGLFKDMEAQG